MEHGTLRQVPLEYLWEGLILSDNIYDHAGNVLLIPRGEQITAEKLKRVANFCEGDRYITTYEGGYQEIVNGKDTPDEIRQKALENHSGYTGLKNSVDHVLQVTRRIKQVSSEEVEQVMVDVYEKLQEMEPADVFSCIDVPRPIDEALQRHSLNVAFLNGMMGRWLQYSEEDIRSLVLIGILHDIGKTWIPEDVLYAPRKLTEEETAIMHRHPVFSYEMLGDEIPVEVKNAVRQHHEKLNGKGYPDGLSGDAITRFARITAISDVYDAMISARCYKTAKLPFDVLEQFREAEFDGLDERLVAVFIQNMRHYYRKKHVLMSDGTIGDILYIPPNDIRYPVICAGDRLQQVDEDWYCIRII